MFRAAQCLSVVLLLAAAGGCRTCLTCFDEDGPVLEEAYGGPDHRVGSILSTEAVISEGYVEEAYDEAAEAPLDESELAEEAEADPT
jgi:hypothetical protein